QIAGSKDFPTTPAQTYELLTNPEVIVRSMPGVKSLKAVSETQYEAEMEVGVAGIKGNYQGKLEMADVVPGERYTLRVNGEGPLGFVEAEVKIALASIEGGCRVTYDGEAKVGGTVAGVGQRVLAGVARFLINQFFNSVVAEARHAYGA
ncbi:MAG: carbon monoxide dehydrogenase subunit G, partial [Alicyclobacillus sp.]|nr:carbon monoxide dehydrogenase subunit G [Alicyclobacillus sp.]